MKFTTNGRVAVFGLITLTGIIAAAVGYAAAPPATKTSRSPHGEAVELVLRTQADAIRKIEAPGRRDSGDESWWFDTKERTWVVKRLWSPGVFDTTHEFFVSYRIDGKEKGRWIVDTRAGTATRWDVEK
jgi:hypothetical protein